MNLFKLAALSLMVSCIMLGCKEQSKNKPVPIDPDVRYGQLENGLTYYIRHNEEPKDRCEFHIAQAVGAILEEDHQNGLAHFLEHMAFNGTKHFKDKGIINYFESLGVNFGGDINAYTSLDETVYRLSNVPTTRDGIIDSALLVMHDWASALTLSDEEIDAERGVIREEWRTGADASRRMWKNSNFQKYPGSQYAKRDVIGDTAIINNFEYQALRDYYHKWYGPDLQAIVVVGDINVDSIEAKIKRLWKDVPARENRGERPIHPIADNKEPIISIVTDKEAQYTRIDLEYKHDVMPDNVKLSMEGVQKGLIDGIISAVLSYRFDEITQKPEASYVAGFAWYGNLVKSKDGFIMVNIAKPNMEMQAVKDLLIEAEKLKQFGITNAEFQRAKADILTQYEQAYNERNNRKNRSITQEYIRHFLDKEIVPGIEWEYNNVKEILPKLTLNKVNTTAKNYITDENLIISFMIPEKEGVLIPEKEEVLKVLAEAKATKLEAPKEDDLDKPLVKEAPKAGKIEKSTKNEDLGTTEWTLSNGVKVVIKPTEFKQDEILMRAYSEGGTSKVEKLEDLPSAFFATDIIRNNGLGEFSYISLQKLLTGKIAKVHPFLSSTSEGFTGNSSVGDFETMLQLIYLHFTAPREDDEAFKALIEMYKTSLINKTSDPKSIFSDSIQMILNNYHPRNILIGLEILPKIDQNKALDIYKERFAVPADFIFFFTGNINPEDKATQKAISTWLGGLESTKETEKYTDRGIRTPKGKIAKYFNHKMEIGAASNRIAYTGEMEYNLANNLNIRVIADILNIRYLESIREKEGGSYGVGVWSYISEKPIEQAYLMMQFDTDPLKQKRLIKIIHQEIDDIAANGPRADDLQKVKENMLKDFAQHLEENNWWHNTVMYRYYIDGINYPKEYKAAVEAITAETVQSTLKELVRQGNEIEVVMLPE